MCSLVRTPGAAEAPRKLHVASAMRARRRSGTFVRSRRAAIVTALAWSEKPTNLRSG